MAMRWDLAALCALALLPLAARAQGTVSLAWQDYELEQRCFGDDDAQLRVYRQRLIYAGRYAGCPGFSPIAKVYELAPMPLDGVKLADSSATCRDYLERSWRQMVALARIEGARAVATFCKHAKGWRDSPDE